VTITAIHLTTGVSGSIEIPVVGPPALIENTSSVDGKKATITLQFKDDQGNVTATGGVVTYNIYAPAGITTSKVVNFGANTGKATFVAEAADYGTYNFTVVSANGLAKTFSVDFAAPAPPPAPKPGAASVTMFIGAKGYVQDGAGKTADLAPFIESGRTFVPVRFLAEAFDAVADWTPKVGAVEVVTLTRDDITITINIGSYVVNVVKDGVASTVTSDVAAYIKDGRTVLPFRVIAEAFGAEVDYGPKDGPIEWVTFKQ